MNATAHIDWEQVGAVITLPFLCRNPEPDSGVEILQTQNVVNGCLDAIIVLPNGSSVRASIVAGDGEPEGRARPSSQR